MDCRGAREALMDRLVDREDASTGGLARHLESCADCRREAETLGRLWADLGRLRVAPADVVRMKEVGEALAQAASRSSPGVVSLLRTRSRATLAAVVGGALAAGFLLGFVSGHFRAVQPAAPAIASTPRFLLLLHETPGVTTPAAEVRSRVAEYGAWARTLQEEGRLVMAEKLGDEPGAWLPVASQESGDVVSGFFLITAEDAADAIGVARASPHLKYGGRIEIRRIEET